MMSILSPGKKNLVLLGAFCLFFCAVEYMIPKPLPFLRIGLANLPLMLALELLPFPSFLILICIKVIGQGLITGTMFSYIFLFSLTGSFFSGLLMFFLRRIFHKNITFIGIGTAGAFVSNISQLLLVQVFIFQENVRYIAPPFLAVGIVTGILLGMFCEVFTRKSVWYNRTAGSEKRREKRKEKKFNCHTSHCNTMSFQTTAPVPSPQSLVTNLRTGNFYNTVFSANALFVTGLLIIPALVFNPSTELRVLQFLFFAVLVLLSGKKNNFIITFLVIVFIIAFNLIIPYGRVLFSFGIFRITSGALTAGIHRAFTFAALIMLSKVVIRQDLKLPGEFGKILGESLRMFSVIMSRKYRIKGKNIFTEIDSLMLELGEEEGLAECQEQVKTKPVGYFILIVVIALSWVPWLI
jgi:heptaprenyl diphosphate synthase